jgi:hypothetical protein
VNKICGEKGPVCWEEDNKTDDGVKRDYGLLIGEWRREDHKGKGYQEERGKGFNTIC